MRKIILRYKINFVEQFFTIIYTKYFKVLIDKINNYKLANVK